MNGGEVPLKADSNGDSTFEALGANKSADSDQTGATKHPSSCSSSGEGSTSDDSVVHETATVTDVSTRNTTWSQKYTAVIKGYEKPLIQCLIAASRISARHPWTTIWVVTMLSFVLVGVGFSTGFTLETSETKLWTPANSITSVHRQWLRSAADFPNEDRYFVLFFHAHGDNVLKRDYVEQVFDVMDTIRNHTEYDEICAASDRVAPDGIYEAQQGEHRTCEISGIPAFFSYQRSIFEQQVRDDNDVIVYLSLETYPDFRPVSRSNVMGKVEWVKDEFGNETGLLESAQSYTLAFLLPDTDEAEEWDVTMIDVVLDFKQQWAAAGSELVVEVISESSFEIEFTRTIIADLPLIPFVYLIMSGFTALAFAKRHKVESRSGLGFAAVFCVMLAIMTGYGVAFLCAVPFTSMTQLLPFLLFGIGLDDAFIISGSYVRTDIRKDLVSRVEETIEECGLSITLTSLTSATAFALGMTSSVPAVNWLVLYAFPTVIIVLIYQLTFFVAAIIIDERRMAANRRDCCCWIKAPEHMIGVKIEGEDSAADRFMAKFAIMLMKPKVKVVVIFVFTAFAAFCGWRVSLLEQQFAVRDVLPDGSYMTDFVTANQEYTDAADVSPYIYFRFVDQSDPATQKLMRDFIDTVVELPQVSKKPARFWLDHFDEFVNMTEGALDLPFNQQLDLFLDDPVMRYIHYRNIMRDDMGNIEVSRVSVGFDEVGYEVVREEIKALQDSQETTAEFEINQGLGIKDWPFFIYSSSFNGWEFFARCINELTMSTATGVVAVTCIGVLLIPHWSAGPILFPFVIILYIDLLGLAQMAGVKVNAVSYIGMTMSIGLIVDYIMHCMLRYYEVPGNREEKCIEMLRTIGISVLMGGVTTFLGTLLLVFASSDIFYTFFVIFFGIVVLGISHGLILLPVVLSIIGPEEQVTTSIVKKHDEKPMEKKVFIYI